MLSRFYATAKAISAVRRRWRSISFAQYAEDVLISILFPRRCGVYVDVGAYHPSDASNTYKLYLRGWSGLTIEPNPDVTALFRRVRPRDIHLNVGISERTQELLYYRYSDPKVNTFSPQDVGLSHGQPIGNPTRIACFSLRQIITEYSGNVSLDLLSIDCEGFDFEVLCSHAWDSHRPTVVIIEDFEQFRTQRIDGVPSKIKTFLRDLGYMPFAQGAFSFLYVDTEALTGKRSSGAFDIERSQLRY